MKVLFDCVYTNRPRICSTSYLVWELIQNLMAWSPDVFFYVLYPPNKMEEADWQFMSRWPDRVKPIPLTQSTSDRVSEEFMLRNQLRFYLNPWCSETWDTDVVVSSRIPVLKHMRVHSAREGGKALRSNRLYVGLEEMPFLPFRDTVPWSDFMYPDTLMSYALSDAVLINNQWTKKALRPVLREVFSVAWQKHILDRVHEVVPVKLQRLNLKQDLYQNGTDFELAFVGRMTGTRNFRGVCDLFRKQFSYPLGPNRNLIKFRVSTNSETIGGTDPGEIDFLDIQMNDRDKFHTFLQGAHLAVNLSTVEDFSLSTYETLKAGVPLIVSQEPWNEFLGSSYPFRAKNLTEAYAMVSAFAENYQAQYARFAQWENGYWADYVNSSLNVTTGEKLIELITQFETHRRQVLRDTGVGGSYKDQVASVKPEDGCIDLTKYIKENGRMLDKVDDHFSLPLGRVPSTLMLKLMAEELGYRDTVDTGVMQKRD